MSASSSAATERKEAASASLPIPPLLPPPPPPPLKNSPTDFKTAIDLKLEAHRLPLMSSKIKNLCEKDAPSTTARRDNDDEDDDDHRVMSSAAPHHVNDIALALPELKKFPRGVNTKDNLQVAGSAGNKAKAGAGAGVLSMAQRVMMEPEWECLDAIKQYREMKERKTKEDDRTLREGGPLGV